MIRAIIFDMGGVILTSEMSELLAKIAERLRIDKKQFADLYYQHKSAILTGKMKMSEFCELARKKFEVHEDILPIWRDTYMKIMKLNIPLLNLIQNLRKKYRIGVITNTVDLHAEINKERGVFKYFDEVAISSDEGMKKPDKEIFDLMTKKLNVKAKECIFVDDHESHVRAAEKMGMNGITFQNNQQLIRELEKAGVKD